MPYTPADVLANSVGSAVSDVSEHLDYAASAVGMVTHKILRPLSGGMPSLGLTSGGCHCVDVLSSHNPLSYTRSFSSNAMPPYKAWL